LTKASTSPLSAAFCSAEASPRPFREGVVGVDGLEVLVALLVQHLKHKLVHVLCQAQDLIAPGGKALGLGQGGNLFDGAAAGIIEIRLILRHTGDVIGQRGGHFPGVEGNTRRSRSNSLL
jgi:hypothetical protein